MPHRRPPHRPTPSPASTPKSLFRRVERTLGLIQQAEDLLGTIRNVAQYMVSNFRDELGISGGRIYRLDEDDYELVQVFGGASDQPLGTHVSRDYVGIQDTIDSGLVVMDRRAPVLDAELENRLGTGERFAAIAVAEGDYIISFDVTPGRGTVEDLQASLNIVRLAINQKLQQEKFAGTLEDARRIQASILPKRSPRYADFEIAGESRAAETVGGDFYDYIPITPEMFDLAIADASGHGLPAALQVRDVYMGLRMGLTRDFKLSRTIERLNAIINRSKLTSKFVSLFLAEMETSGNLIYVNAGHVLPFILHADKSIEYLREGGMVLGPSPDARYLRGFAHLEPGAVLVLYTDGITECRSRRSDREFGIEKLQSLVRRHADRPAAEIVQIVFEAADRHSGLATPEDGQTVVIVRPPPPPPPST
jgi:sigma-B regulation protein RsbU (phosphoserine phosphatase)